MRNRFRVLAIIGVLGTLVGFGLNSSAFADENYFLGGGLGYTGVSYHANSTLQGFSDAQTSGTSLNVPYSLDLAFLFGLPDHQTAAGVGFDGVLDAYFPKGSY